MYQGLVDTQQFTLALLSALQPVKKPRERAGKGMAQAAISPVVATIPHALKVVPALFGYAEHQRINIDIGGSKFWVRPIGQPTALSDGLHIQIERSAMGETERETFRVPYANDMMRQICSPGWHDIGAGQVSLPLDHLLPQVSLVGSAVRLEWPPGFRPQIKFSRAFGLVQVGLSIARISVFRDHGEIMTGELGRWILPRLKWGA